MASVHPSRAGLVPQGSASRERSPRRHEQVDRHRSRSGERGALSPPPSTRPADLDADSRDGQDTRNGRDAPPHLALRIRGRAADRARAPGLPSSLPDRPPPNEGGKGRELIDRLGARESSRERRNRYGDGSEGRYNGYEGRYGRRSEERDGRDWRDDERESRRWRGQSRDSPRRDFYSPRRQTPPHSPRLRSPRRGERGDRSHGASPAPRAPAPEPVVAGPPIRLGFDNLGTPPLGLPPWKPGGGGSGPASGAASPRRGPHKSSTNLEQYVGTSDGADSRRREQREATEVNIWPDSPERQHAYDDDDAAQRKEKRKSKRRSRRYASETDDSEDEYERRRREKRRRARERERGGDKDRDRDREKRRRRDDSERQRTRSRSRSASRPETSWVEKGKDRARADNDDDDGPEVGPAVPAEHVATLDRDAYRALLPGEGEAMAAYVQAGARIPRRGEIGMDADRIAQFEESGYVMSGNRHARMTAVRQRKENQVISAEEKRLLLVAQREQAQQKEGAIISQFKEMMDERLQQEAHRERRAQETQRRDAERDERSARARR